MITGFRAFHIFNFIKHLYFNSKKFVNPLELNEFPRENVFLKKWNEEIIKKSNSMMFYKLDRRFPHQDDLIRLFSYYYINDDTFYVTSIYEDEFRVYKKFEWERKNISNMLETDFIFILSWALEKKRKLSDIFKTDKYSIILKMYDRKKICFHSLICFERAFNTISRIKEENLNIIELEKFKLIKRLVDKYSIIVYKDINFNPKEFLRKTYQQIMERDK